MPRKNLWDLETFPRSQGEVLERRVDQLEPVTSATLEEFFELKVIKTCVWQWRMIDWKGLLADRKMAPM